MFTPNVDTVVRLGEARIQRCRLPSAQRPLHPSRRATRSSGPAGCSKRPLRSRLAGSDLVPPLWRRIVGRGSNRDGHRLMRGGGGGAAGRAALARRLRSTGLRPRGPRRAAPRSSMQAMCAGPRRTRVRLRGHLVPEATAAGLRADRSASTAGRRLPVFLLIGGSFDMYVGRTRARAQRGCSTVGAEWFFRFLLEPRRLFHRYFVEDMRFLSIVQRELRTARVNRRGRRPAGVAWRLSRAFIARRLH